MESEKRKAVPLVKEYQIRSSLASEASLEPLLPGPKPIYADIQQDWLSDQLGSEVYLPILSQQSQAQTSASLINSTEGPYVEFPTNIGMTSQEFAAQRMNNFLSQWKNKARQETINMSASLHEDSCSSSQLQALFECQTNMPNECPGVQGLDYNDPLVQGNKLSFQDLLAMKMPQGNISTFTSDLNCQPQDEILNARSASTQQSSTNCVEEMQCHFPCRLWTYDLNSPLGTENILTNGCRQVYQPEAACPCQIIEENIVAEDKSLCTGSSSNQQNEKAEGQVAVSRVYELENPVAESSSVMIENHNPDKGFNNIDLNETPQRKSRRRKHRPKVVSEDKPKRTSKLKVSQPTNSEGMPKRKRKYIRKNETHPPSTPPSAVISSTEVVDPKESVCAVKSCRRGLNFGVDDHEKIEGLQSNKTNSAGLEPVSGIHCRNEDKLTAGSVDNLSHKVNQMQRNCIAVPEFEKPKRTPKPKVSQPKNSTGMPKRKRKCVQKNEINLSPTPSSAANFSAEAVDPKGSVCAVKSCRRGLNFEEDGNEKIKGSQKNKTNAAGLESFSAIYHAREDRLTAGSADNVSQRANQMLKNCITVPEFGKVSCVSQEQLKADAVYESQVNGNCQAAAASLIKGDMTSPQASSPNSSVCASSKEGLSMKESKGVYSNVHDEVHMKAKNLNSTTHGTFYQSSPLHLQKRTEKVQKPITETSSTTVSEASRKTNSAHDHERGNPGTTKYYQYCIPPLLTTCSITNCQADAVGVTGKRPKSRISEGNCDKAEAQICDLISWTGYAAGKRLQTQLTKQKRKYSGREKFNHLNRSPSFMEALAAECSTTQTENKRPRKKYSTLNLNESSICDTNMQRSLVPYDDPQSVRNYRGAVFGAGPYLALPWKHSHPIDGITDTLEQLDIHRERSQTQRESAIALHFTNNQAQNALVHYKKDDTMVPFEGDPIRKRHQRARVYLDEETNRVWRLLLENINNEGIDGTDEEKAKWWANERRVFCGRVDSFIARMRLVQGDRRFTPWKGSVVDSVVGVFLTQNVSDHLSSSAFMSVAARFPLKSQGEIRIDSEGNSILVEEPMEPDNAVTWIGQTMDEPVCDRTSWTFHDIDHGEEKEVENSKEPLSAVSLNYHSCRNTCSTENSQKMHHEMITFGANRNHEEKRTSTSEDAKAIDEIALLQHSVVPSHNLADSPTAPTAGRFGSCSDSNSEQEDLTTSSRPNLLYPPSSFVELLKMAETSMLPEAFLQNAPTYLTANQIQSDKKEHKWKAKQNADCIQMLDREIILSDNLSRKDQSYSTKQSDLTTESMIQFPFYNRTPDSNQKPSCSAENTCSSYVFERQKMIIESQRQSTKQDYPDLPSSSKNDCVTENISVSDEKKKNMHTFSQPFLEKSHDSAETPITQNQKATKHARGSSGKDGKTAFDWEGLRKQAQAAGGIRERTANTRDSLDWEAVRRADVSEIAETIKDRGMNNKLAERIKDFLDRLVREHGSIDLEWLRDVPPDRAKEYLLSIRGLGLKSVECVRLLTLHHLAFPVDTNVGRIAVRLGWVPLQPLPESLQLHLLELYPVLESIQKYLWPRLCKLDQRTLYELHYHMITFGKVFCTKRQPNCNACPLRGECRHFASAFASARLGLPGPEERRIMTSTQVALARNDPQPQVTINPLPLPATQENPQSEVGLEVRNCEPIIEVPASPEPEQVHDSEYDIEDAFFDDSDIPTIKLNMDQFTQTLQNLMQGNMELQQVDMSKALVALTAEAASIPTPKLKNVSRLRTEHHVYELPDNHPLLKGLDKREPDDPCSYLLAIWTPGETANSIQPPEKRCTSEGLGELCEDLTCFYCNSQRETSSQIVRGTLLIPCRTAMRGSFPLNGTYFQVNEVFADHDSSLSPLSVPRGLIWHLPRKTVYFGTSVPTIFRGLSTEGIQHCFWKGYVCVRGFDQQSRAPRPLMARLHFPRSKMTKTGAKASQRDE